MSTALRNFALNLPAEVDGDLPGGKWCDECGIVTNHIGAMHRGDEREPDDVKPDEEPLDEEDDDADDDCHC